MTSVAAHRLIIDPPAPGAWNMAVDEALLIEAAENGVATLRFYQWNEPTLSLGYFQSYDDRQQHAASGGCACVRRQTGGGAIVHDHEMTYSIVLAPDHPCAQRSSELYARVHDAFIETLLDTIQADCSGISLHRYGGVSTLNSPSQPFLCFERRAMGDVVATLQRGGTGTMTSAGSKGLKILGSAQRRSRGALLQHGSLLLEKSTAAPELVGFYDIAGAVSPAVSAGLLIPRLEAALAVRFCPGSLPQNVESNARQLANSKYEAAAWTKRR